MLSISSVQDKRRDDISGICNDPVTNPPYTSFPIRNTVISHIMSTFPTKPSARLIPTTLPGKSGRDHAAPIGIRAIAAATLLP
jgi:hypothetical protein